MSAAASESDGALSTVPVALTRLVRDQTTWLSYAAWFNRQTLRTPEHP